MAVKKLLKKIRWIHSFTPKNYLKKKKFLFKIHFIHRTNYSNSIVTERFVLFETAHDHLKKTEDHLQIGAANNKML